MINEAKNMKKKLKTSVTPHEREKVKEMHKKRMKAHSTIVKENKKRMRKMAQKKRQEKEDQETLKIIITNSSTRPESGAPMKRRKETEKYNVTTSEVPPEKKMKLEQKLDSGNKQEKVVNKNLESADGISTQSVVNVTVTRHILRSDIGTDISMEKGNSLLSSSSKFTEKTKNMRSLLPMNISTDIKTQKARSLLPLNITDEKTQNARSLLPFNVTDEKTQNATSLLPFNITDETTQNARNSQPLNITMDKKTPNLRSLLTFQISTDKSSQNSRSLLHFKITDKKSQNERSFLPHNTGACNKKEDVNCLSPLNADHSNMKQNSKSLLPLKAGPETENQGARSLLSLNAGQVTESQNARSLLSFNSGPVTEGQSSTSLLSLDAGQVILTESHSAVQVAKSQNSTSLLSLNAGQVILTESRSAGRVAKSQNSTSLLSLNAGQVTESQSSKSLLLLNAGQVTKSRNARSLLSLDASPVTKGENAGSLLSLETSLVTKSQNARSLLSLDAGQVSNSQNPKSLSSLNAGAVTESQNARSLLSLKTSPVSKSQNARSLLPLNIHDISTVCDTKNSRSLLHNVKLPLNAGTVIKTQNQEIFQSTFSENKSQREHSKSSVSSNKDFQQNDSKEGPSQTVQSVLDTENVQENIFSVCINRTKGSPDVKIIQEGIGKEVNKKNRLENLLKQGKLCTHHLQTEGKKENLQSTCTSQKRSVAKPSKERKSQRYLKRGRRLKEKYKYKSLSEESETETDKPASLLRSREITDYQIQDLNWLLTLFTHGINGVLAEEMGLSKTVQAIALLRYMKDYQQISGPHLFIVPLTDIDHWLAEFKSWSPESRLVVIKGTAEQKRPAFKDILKEDDWDVCITSFETCLQEPNVFKEMNWRYLAVDEDQTIIKEKTQISEIIQSMKTSNKLLLTGTQTQNDLQELLALQNFLLPGTTNNTICRSANQLCNKELVSCLHNILHPFLLKRIKADLEKGLLPTKEIYINVGLYTLQRDWQTIQSQDLKEQLDDNMNMEKKMEILKHVSLPNQSKLEIMQPCKGINPSVGLKSLLKDNTSIGNRTLSRKTLQRILPANKSTQGSFQKNFTKSYPLNDLLTKGSGEGSSQNVQITSDCRNSPERIFSVCVESLKDSPNIKAGVERKVEQNKVNFDLQSSPDELSMRHKLRRNKKHITELNAKVEGKDNYSNEEESNDSEEGKKEKSSDDEIFLKDKLSGSEIQEKYLSFVKHYINGEFEYKGTRKSNCIPAVSDHQSVCPCIVCGDQAVGMYFGIMVCYSCRTFIVATVQYRSILKCEAQSNCTIYFRKEFCPHCRFKKCLWAGAVVAKVPLRLQKLSKFKQSLTVKRKKQPKRISKGFKEKTSVKPATAGRCGPTMYLTSDTDCNNTDDCDKLVDNSYPIKWSGGQKGNSYPIKSGGQKDNSYPIKSGGQKDNSYPIKLSGGQKDNSYPIKLSGGQKKHILYEKLTSISSIKSESSQVTKCSVIKETSNTEVQLKPLSEKHNMEDNFHYFKQNSRPISTSDILTDWQRLHKSVQEQFQKLKN